MKIRFYLSITLLFCSLEALCQVEPVAVKYYYPKDSAKYEKEIVDFNYSYEKELYGKTTMIIHAESNVGFFEFIFKKKVRSIVRYGGNYSDVYGTKADGSFGVVSKSYNEPYTISQHDLYAFILLHDHGGFIEKVKFQDFGNEVYWPEFDYPNCTISDEDKDGCPEFYLSYMGNSDGLDAKPYKQIIYTYANGKYTFIKSKATAYYPAGNEEDTYHVDFDSNWKSLPKAIQQKSIKIIQDYRQKHPDE